MSTSITDVKDAFDKAFAAATALGDARVGITNAQQYQKSVAERQAQNVSAARINFDNARDDAEKANDAARAVLEQAEAAVPAAQEAAELARQNVFAVLGNFEAGDGSSEPAASPSESTPVQ